MVPTIKHWLSLVFVVAAFLGLAKNAAAASTVSNAGVCSDTNMLLMIDASGTTPSECSLPGGTFLIESLYYQNASKVGATALAAYPMLRLLAGATARLDIMVDAPSQIAESNLQGNFYPGTRGGFGLNYGIVQSLQSSVTIGAEVDAPASLYEPSETQPKYRFGASSLFQLDRGVFLNASLDASSSQSIGFNQIYPMAKIGLGMLATERTKLNFDLGTQAITRRASLQSFGDASVTQLLHKNLSLDVGIGSAFNPVKDTKAHYLATGLNFRP